MRRTWSDLRLGNVRSDGSKKGKNELPGKKRERRSRLLHSCNDD
jgi:hypothetical protein